MTAPGELLAALQFADGLFPAGGFAVSNGLERLADGGRLPPEALDAFFDRELNGRFGPFDRVAIVQAHRAGGDIVALASLDRRIERMSWASVQREAGARSGRALLAAARRLELPGAGPLEAAIRRGDLIGHQQMVWGVVLRQAGIREHLAVLVAAHRFLAGLTNAAVRLGQIGAVGAQAVLTRHYADMTRWAASPIARDTPLTTFHPEADIAMMRHRSADTRLFAA